MKIGLDVGSTTLKCVVLDDAGNIVYKNYERHLSRITEKTAAMLSEIASKLGENEKTTLCISGSAGMGLADDLGIPFVQEVYATRLAVSHRLPGTDAVIELGGGGCENPVSLRRHGGAHERLLCRRYGCFYRSNGHPAEYHPDRAQRNRQAIR